MMTEEQSIFEYITESIMSRLADKVPELRYIEPEFGQLENYGTRPAVSWPCALIDINDTLFSDASAGVQLGDTLVEIRLAMPQYSPVNNLAPAQVRAKGFEYYRLEKKVNAALHTFSTESFSKLLRRGAKTEQRNDDIRVRVLRFVTSFKETPAPGTRVPIPKPIINSR